jgi:hypothetical protein
MDKASFAKSLRGLVHFLETGNKDQAELAIQDALAYLNRLLKSQPDRAKTGTRSQGEPITFASDFGESRVQETRDSLESVRSRLDNSDFTLALTDARIALEKWETGR